MTRPSLRAFRGARTVRLTAVPRTPAIPARVYSSPEYRRGYAAGLTAGRADEAPENPYLPQDPRHPGWADACYDLWSARRIGRGGGSRGREESRHPATAGAFTV